MANDSFEETAQGPNALSDPSSFTFSVDKAHTVNDLPNNESLDEQNDHQKLGNIPLEDSTLALMFGSPVKSILAPLSISPAKTGSPSRSEEGKGKWEASYEEHVSKEIVVTGPTVKSIAAGMIANVPTSMTHIPNNVTNPKYLDVKDVDTTNSARIEDATADHDELPNAKDPDAQLENTDEIAYPASSDVIAPEDHKSSVVQAEDAEREAGGEADAEMSEVDLGAFVKPKTSNYTGSVEGKSAEEEFTEVSMQLGIQEEYEREGELASQPSTPKRLETQAHDITRGLTLGSTPAKIPSREHTPKKLHSPPPPLRIDSGPDDATMSIAIDDDTAILKSFLSRAAASKAERTAIITRRESLENRRDSDIVRHALASPRKALEDKDPNSPSKIDSEFAETPLLNPDVGESSSLTVGQPKAEDTAEAKEGRGSRRSSRTKKSRLPAPATTAQLQTSNKISIRRADGTDPVVIKKTDAQELALITRNNTRKNKQGAFMVSLRLLKLQAEAILSPPTDISGEKREPIPGRKGIRWDETLAYYQEHADTIAMQQAEAASLATPDELSLPAPNVVPSTKKAKTKTSTDKNSTPKIRRVRGLGTANSTPGKGLLVTGSLLPESVQEEQAATAIQPPLAQAVKVIPKPKATKRLPVASAPTDSKLATLEVTPVGVEPVKERKSRIAPPKSVRLPKSVAAAAPPAAVEKENMRTGISDATPRKGIPAPRIIVPKAIVPPAAVGVVGMESGLPRRRGRKA